MQLKPLESTEPRLAPLRLVTAVAHFAVIAAMAGCSLPDKDAARDGAQPAVRVTDTGTPDAADVRPTPVPVTGVSRSRVNCRECAVVDSMRTIDTHEDVSGWCAVGDIAGTRIPGNLVAGDLRNDLAALADTVTAAIAGEHRAKKARVTTRHQIVVRFYDGSRHVFSEETPRSLRAGDRIKVIAGPTGRNG